MSEWMAISFTIVKVLLCISLRRPIHFDYQIEFFDVCGDLLDTMEGEKGKQTFQYTVRVHHNIEMMARFKIGEVTGPDSDTVIIDVTESMLIAIHVQPFFHKVAINNHYDCTIFLLELLNLKNIDSTVIIVSEVYEFIFCNMLYTPCIVFQSQP